MGAAMCNFMPGQVIAIGPKQILAEIGGGLPGQLGPVIPLVGEGVDSNNDSELRRLAYVVLKTDPGMELYAMSRLSARLSGSIEKNEAAVDLNHILPLAMSEPFPISTLRLSPHAEREASAVRRLLRSAHLPKSLRIAVLDSGLASDFSAHRELRYFDYTTGGRLTRDVEPFDPMGHGTRVVSILDQILPPEVSISIGRLPSAPGSLTALTVAQALADIIARETPDVVNLSVCLRNDWFVCPHCKQRVPAPTFLSGLLPLVVRLGGKSISNTLTVMAAGNTGQAPNSRWLTDDVNSLLFAFAENRRGERTLYSSAPEGPRGDLCSVGAFGGDDPSDHEAQGVFIDGVHGTSFAAPFISAASLLTKRFPPPIGPFTREVIEAARQGRFLRLRIEEVEEDEQ